MMTMLIASYAPAHILGQIPSLSSGPFGGIGSWIIAALILAALLYLFLRYAREVHAAESLLNQRELPCPRCGYPLPHEAHPTCPECGTPQAWTDTAKYWKNENLVDPLKIRSDPPKHS